MPHFALSPILSPPSPGRKLPEPICLKKKPSHPFALNEPWALFLFKYSCQSPCKRRPSSLYNCHACPLVFFLWVFLHVQHLFEPIHQLMHAYQLEPSVRYTCIFPWCPAHGPCSFSPLIQKLTFKCA